MSKPIVAIVGRPNVGKSTLFNVLAGETISIVKDTPGVTRDRIYADCNWLNMNFTLVDTGGIEPDSRDIILSQMREQAQIAIDTADVIIFIVDVRQGLQDSDSKVADMLRKSGKPVVLAVNKVDSVAKFGNGGSGMILSGKNIAGSPADIRAQFMQGADEHGRLDGHVQRTHALKALQGLGVAVTADEFHEAGHFALGKLHFLFAEVSEGNIGHLVGQRKIKRFRVGHVRLHKKLSVTGAGPV